jgi:transcriptional regulator
MYIPKIFEEVRPAVLHQLIESEPFGSLVTLQPSGLFASHIPMVLERDGGSLGVLKGHLSRANLQWKNFSKEVEALAIFSGPQHYITPTWYPEKTETGRVVPTWNYAVVHAYGELKIVENEAWLRGHLESLTNIHEASSPVPWKVTDAPDDYIASQIRGIVGFEVAITRLEGKWKASQNRSERDRIGVANGLSRLDTEDSQAMRILVEERRG